RALLLRLVLLLPRGDQRVGADESVLKGTARGQRLLEVGPAEVGEVVLVGAAERGAIVPRRGDDQARVVAQRLDEAARIAGGDDDHLPADAALLQQAPKLARRQVAQRHVVLPQRELVLAVAVAGDKEEQDVLIAVHARGNGLQRLADREL